MPAPHPGEFRRRAVESARLRDKPIAQLAADLGISQSCLRNWVRHGDIDQGRREGLSSGERAELVRLRRELRAAQREVEILKRASAYFGPGERPPKIKFRLVHELAADGMAIAVTCRVLGVSRAGYYDWVGRPPSPRMVADRQLLATITTVHQVSRGTYGSPRVHAELRLGLGIGCGGKRIARLMRTAGLVGVCHRRKRGRSSGPAPAVHDDLVQRRFITATPNPLWCTDVTEHPTGEGECIARSCWTCPAGSSWDGR